MATLMQNKFRFSRKKAFIPSPRVLTPLGVKAIHDAVSGDSAPCENLTRAIARYKALQATTKQLF